MKKLYIIQDRLFMRWTWLVKHYKADKHLILTYYLLKNPSFKE